MADRVRSNIQKPSDELSLFIERHLAAAVVVSTEPLLGGDMNESVIVDVESGERFVARRPLSPGSPWAPDIGGQVAAHRLAADAGVPVPEVIAWDSTALLYRFVPGRPISPGAALWRNVADLDADVIDPDTAYEAGRTYGRLHATSGAGLGAMQADGSHPGWDRSNYFGPEQSSAVALLELDLEPFGMTPDTVRTAAAILRSRTWPVRSRLVHGDASPANTLVDDRGVLTIIDFDAAAWADPAIDLAWWWYHSPPTADAFAAGCAETSEPTDQETASAYRLRLLVGLGRVLASHNARYAARLGALLRTTISDFA